MTMLRLAVMFGALGILLAASPAGAITWESQVGSACSAVYPYPYVYSEGNNVWHEPVGIESADNTYPKYVTCPMQRVNATSTTGLSGAYVDMYDTGGGAWCYLNAYDEYGNNVGSIERDDGTATGNRELSFGSLSTSDMYGFYSLYCVLLPATSSHRSIIYSYQWGER